MIGNDVVDLADPAIAGHHRKERFVARVCAPEERGRVASKADLWTLFAAKEATYKVLVKLGHAPGFAHRAIVVAPDLDSALWRGVAVHVAVAVAGEYVHALAWTTGDGPPPSRCVRAHEPLELAARTLLCETAARVAGCDPSELRVVRDAEREAWDGYGPPRIERAGKALALDVSLSHDGRFVAAAARLTSS